MTSHCLSTTVFPLYNLYYKMASALHPEFLEYTWAPVRTNILEADLFVGAWAMVKTLTSVLALHSSGSTIRHVALPPPLTVVDVLGPPSPLPPSELSRWRDADDGKVDDVPTTSPTAALAPGCRVVVNPEARDGQRLGGFLAESISPTVVRVRLFVHGERIDPRERAFVDKLLSPGMVGDYGLFDIQNVKAHFLAGECNLKSSDLVYFNNGPRRGRHARFRIIRDRICTVVCAGEFVDVSLSDVARGFHVGDTVQVLHGTFAGAIGEITGLRSLASNFGCMDVTAGGILTINVTYYPQSLLCRTINVLAYFAIYLPPAPQPPVASTSTIAPTMENDHSASNTLRPALAPLDA
ncbi:hypothetical protein MKEN_01012300 [Mycena kentingensis (nom. inval.)]|nr:hypothetical protein MKEN_01012300 [Mycena kentingensis (nom. inval.)]